MADLINDSAETFSFSDGLVNHPKVQNGEAINFIDFLAKGSNGVYGDMAINNTAMTAADFESFFRDRPPLGYAPFKDLVPGDFNYQTGYLLFVFEPAPDVNAVLSAQSVVFNADVPDLIDSGTYSVLAVGSTITFNRSFAVAPKITVVPLNASAATVTLTAAPSASSFAVKVFNSAGTAIACDIHWTAIGY